MGLGGGLVVGLGFRDSASAAFLGFLLPGVSEGLEVQSRASFGAAPLARFAKLWLKDPQPETWNAKT